MKNKKNTKLLELKKLNLKNSSGDRRSFIHGGEH